MKFDICDVNYFLKTALLLILFLPVKNFAQTPFITVWKTDNPGGSSMNTQIKIPATGTFSYTWERVGGTASTGSGSGNGETTITFPQAGTYRVRMTPTGTTNKFNRIAFSGPGSSDCNKLIGVEQWGSVVWSSMRDAFTSTNYLTSITATDIPNLTMVATMQGMFSFSTSLTSVANIDNWDVSHVTNMRNMFREANVFNSKITSWDVSNVTTMQDMFHSADAFNQPIGVWNVSKVTTMYGMFQNAEVFNQPLGNWDVSSVINMSNMFYSALVFNQPIGGWDVSKVTLMPNMFLEARKFNMPIEDWDVSSVTNMSFMFFNADKFNQPINDWDVSKVTNMSSMFSSADEFDKNLGNWNLTSVANVSNMFNLTALSCNNYSNILIGWAGNANTPNNLSLTNNFLFAGGSIKYGTAAVTARDALINTKNWTITGDMLDQSCQVTTLPVTFVEFNVSDNNRNNLLEWRTASEHNNKGFEILKSSDGSHWYRIGFVSTKASLGNSNNLIEYHFNDFVSHDSDITNYYKIKQIDFNGNFEYSKVVLFQTDSENTTIQVLPNLITENFIISGLQEKSQISITNSIGQQVLNINTDENINETVDCSSWTKGVYFIKIEDTSSNFTIRKVLKI